MVMGRLLVDDQQLLELLLVARWLVVRVGKGMLGYGEIERERKKRKERREEEAEMEKKKRNGQKGEVRLVMGRNGFRGEVDWLDILVHFHNNFFGVNQWYSKGFLQ